MNQKNELHDSNKPDDWTQWRKWNAQGFIPAPEESESAFRARITFCLNLNAQLKEAADETSFLSLTNPSDLLESKKILEEAFPLTEELYGIHPEWVPLYFANDQLAPWHGGSASFFQFTKNGPIGTFLQLRAPFRHRTHYLGIYHRSELIAHELSHVGRMAYEEAQFEEFFAYQSSPNSWRRFFGPIVQSSRESLLFVLSLILVLITDGALFFSSEPSILFLAFGTKLFSAFLVACALCRLTYRHIILKRSLHRLENILSTVDAKHLLYRLRDSEIKQLARLSHKKGIEYMRKQIAGGSFRWRFLEKVYALRD